MAYSLTFTSEQGEQQTVELSSELSVGRTNLNDVILNDQGVSRKHCRFFIGDDGQVFVEDLGSANGVQVNGVSIAQPTAVTASSQITVGKTNVQLIAPERSRPARRNSSAALARREAPAGGDSNRRALRRRDSQEKEESPSRGGAMARRGAYSQRERSQSLQNVRAKAMKPTSRGKLK